MSECEYQEVYIDPPASGCLCRDIVYVEELPETGEEHTIYVVPQEGGGIAKYYYSNGEWIEI